MKKTVSVILILALMLSLCIADIHPEASETGKF